MLLQCRFCFTMLKQGNVWECAMGTTGIQKTSFALLVALIIYVAIMGG